MSTAELTLRKSILDMLKDVDDDFVIELGQYLISTVVKKHKSKSRKTKTESTVQMIEGTENQLPDYFKNFEISPKVKAMTLPNRVDFDYDKELEEALMEKYL